MAEKTVLTKVTAISLDFKDMDDFVAEQDAIDKQLSTANPPPRASKQSNDDPQVFRVEKEALEEVGAVNWIGKLLEYRQANPLGAGDSGIQYNETSLLGKLNPRFCCTVRINESEEIFGCSGAYGFTDIVASFSAKKVARQFAAKRAIDFLVENKHMPNHESVRFPRVAPPPPPAANPDAIKDGESPYSTQVPPLCRLLGFQTPTYRITPVFPSSPLCSGYADFGNDPRVDGPVGRVENVFGKKNAKEAVARIVVSFLKDIEKHRLGGSVVEDTVEEDEEEVDDEKKRKRSSTDVVETSNKALKI